MNRIWSIKEQTFVDVNTRLRFEFTSAHTLASERGIPAPATDERVMLCVYNESGTRILTLEAKRNGDIMNSTVEPNLTGKVPPTEQEKAREEGVSLLDLLGSPADVSYVRASEAQESAAAAQRRQDHGGDSILEGTVLF